MKPCKFCNGEAEIIDNGYGLVNNKSVHCKKCGMRLYLPWCTDRETAGKMWNELVGNNEKIKHGKWEDNKVAFYQVCSVCGCGVRSRKEVVLLNSTGHQYNYCPNCGAKMSEVISE